MRTAKPIRVATLIKNSSGVQLTYRGAGVLPHLQQLRSPDFISRGKIARHRSSGAIKPVSHSARLMEDVNSKLADENKQILSRLV